MTRGSITDASARGDPQQGSKLCPTCRAMMPLTSSSAGAAGSLDSFHHVYMQPVHESESEMVARLAGEEVEYVMGLTAHGANRPAKHLHETALVNIIMPNTPKKTRTSRGGRRSQNSLEKQKRRQNAIPEGDMDSVHRPGEWAVFASHGTCRDSMELGQPLQCHRRAPLGDALMEHQHWHDQDMGDSDSEEIPTLESSSSSSSSIWSAPGAHTRKGDMRGAGSARGWRQCAATSGFATTGGPQGGGNGVQQPRKLLPQHG